jgi:hypothetical protein
MWGVLAAEAEDFTSAAQGFATAVGLLPQLAGRRLGRSDAQYWPGRFTDLAADAAVCSPAVGDVVGADAPADQRRARPAPHRADLHRAAGRHTGRPPVRLRRAPHPSA